MHSKPVAGPGASTNVVANETKANDNDLEHSPKHYPNQTRVKQAGQAKRVVAADLLAVAKQKLKRFVRQLRCSVSDAAATQPHEQQHQQQQMLLAAR